MESPLAKGALYVFDDHFFPEIVSPDTGEQLPDGEIGELVITTLTKEGQPVIRYRTRDLTRFVDEPGADGRTFRRIDRLHGRVDDMLIIRGINVYPIEVETVVMDDPGIGGQYAVIVDRRGTMPELRVVAEVAAAELESQRAEIAARLAGALSERIRIRVDVEIRSAGSMPRQETGKAKRVYERTTDEEPLG